MTKTGRILGLLLALVAVQSSYAQDVEPINYTHGEIVLEGYRALPKGNNGTNVPAVVILPDANGVNDYEQLRAVMIAEEFGFVGFAADIYGIDLHNVTDRAQRDELLDLYRLNATLYTERIQAAIDLVASFETVDADNIAIIGYCFGGTGVLTYSLSGLDSVKAAVSFHGGLATIPAAGPVIVPKILVLSGGEDDMSTDIVDLEETLNSVNASWEITRYSGIEHAFTVFGDDRYNEWADMRSWESMRGFLEEALAKMPFESQQPDAVTVEDVPYTDIDGAELQGYLSLPGAEWESPYPTVVILPDWDGVNQYEKERATLLSSLGYSAFAADIYGVGLQNNLTDEMKFQYYSMYHDNMTLFVQRIERAIAEVKTVENVDTDNIFVIGYCMGGTGIIQLAFSGNDDVKGVVSFHGGLTTLPPAAGNITPYTLILSGGADDAHGNQTFLEESLDAVNANWEVTRYSGVVHGFTAWEYGDAYSLRADTRSWDSMLTALAELRKMPLRVEGEEGDDSGTGGGDSGPSAPMPVRSPTASESTQLKANLFGVAGVVSLLVSLSLLMS